MVGTSISRSLLGCFFVLRKFGFEFCFSKQDDEILEK